VLVLVVSSVGVTSVIAGSVCVRNLVLVLLVLVLVLVLVVCSVSVSVRC
jgi:hypothetical protein